MSSKANFGTLYSKIKNKEVPYFGLKNSGKKSLAQGQEDYIADQNFKKELVVLNSIYTNKDYSGVISSASAMVKRSATCSTTQQSDF